MLMQELEAQFRAAAATGNAAAMGAACREMADATHNFYGGDTNKPQVGI
jgi:hypothetical protein